MKKLIVQILSFIGVSGIGWLIDFVIYTILTNKFGLNLTISNVISSFAGVTFVFITSTKKIFVSNSKIDIKIKYIIYIVYEAILILGVSLLMPILNDFIKSFDIDFLTKYANIATKIIVTPFTMCINFIVMKNLIEKL